MSTFETGERSRGEQRDRETQRRPQRIQLRRTAGWRKPEGAIVVSRPSRWGNEFETSENPRGHWHADNYDVSRRMMTTQRVADRSEGRAVVANAYRLALPFGGWDMPSIDEIRAELRGRDLCCWCPLDEKCHADVLLEIANTPEAVAWFHRTGHCHGCGCPGTYCVCKSRCGCHELHEVGSGLRDGALDAFAETVVSDEQGELPL